MYVGRYVCTDVCMCVTVYVEGNICMCVHRKEGIYVCTSIFTRLTPGMLKKFCRSHADLSYSF